MFFKKDNNIYKTPIKIDTFKTIPLKKDKGNGKYQSVEKKVKVVIWTNDQSIIVKNGFEKCDEKNYYRYNKRKIKNKLAELGYWQLVKNTLTADQYQDLILSEDFSFDDKLFVKCYQMLKAQIENIDELLIECRRV